MSHSFSTEGDEKFLMETLEASSHAGQVSDSNQSDTGKSDTGKSDTGKSDTDKSDTGKSDTGKSDTDKSDTGKSDTDKSDTDKSDTGKSDTGKSDTDISGLFHVSEQNSPISSPNSQKNTKMLRIWARFHGARGRGDRQTLSLRVTSIKLFCLC